jgi:twitching motility protein PilT
VDDNENTPESTDHIDHARPHRGNAETDAFLRAVVRTGASDLHLKAGQSARVRVNGKLRSVDREPAPTEEFESNVFEFLKESEREELLSRGSVDFAYNLDGTHRFRFNVYRQESGISIAARIVPRDIPALDDLNLPETVKSFAELQSGLVLVAGTTGSGKSTTLAALLERINQERSDHVITIEDPIEFLFTSKKALFNQREIGINVVDFPTALRGLLREDPDVVMIGEMRDAETFRAALQVADSGHLVFSTVHAGSSSQCIARILNLFPEDEHPSIRQSLALGLRSIVTQRLVPSIKPEVKRVPATEVLVVTPGVRKIILDGRERELTDVVRKGDEGMMGFSESLNNFLKAGFIDEDIGIAAAPNPDEFKRIAAGIKII